MKKATIIIPTYNESGIIKSTIEILEATFKKIKNWQMSILIVDDSSPDGTAQIIQNLQKQQHNLHLLVKKEKKGLGAAYLAGMKKAFTDLKTDVVFEFDADLSHDPSKIPLFLKKLDEDYDMVLGSRYIAGGSIPSDWGLHRKFLSVVGNLFIMIILANFKIRDWTGGYRAIKKKVYEAVVPELKKEEFSGYTFQVGFLHKAVTKKFRICEIPFHFKDRTIGSSKMGPDFIINNLKYLLRVRIKEILEMRVFKFAVVGTIGALTQLISLQIIRPYFPYQLAFFLAMELAVLTNFIISNSWTFKDRQLKKEQYLPKFLQFNLASAGSIIIQQVIAIIGEFVIGIHNLFTLPFINLIIDSGLVYAILGILIGMFWNFFAYTTFIWKKQKNS